MRYPRDSIKERFCLVALGLIICVLPVYAVTVHVVERPRPSAAAGSEIEGWTNSIMWYEFTIEADCGDGDYDDSSNDGTHDGATTNVGNRATWTDDVTRGPCLDFDGSDDYVDGGDLGLATTDDFTICAWFKTAVSNQNQRIISMTTGEVSAQGQVFIRVGTDEKAHVYARGKDTDDPGYKQAVGNVVDNQWHHMLATIKGSIDTVEIYVDGLSKGTEGGTWTATNLTSTTIGNLCPELNQEFDGLIDDPRVYDRVLTTGEIYQIFLGDV